MELPAGSSVEVVVEYLCGAAFRIHCLESKIDQLENLLSSFRETEARINTIAVRLDSLESEVAVLQQCFVSEQPGVSLRAAVSSLNIVVTQAVETLNRVEGETLRLLRWRDRFSAAVQGELNSLGLHFSAAGSQIASVRLDELD